MFGVRDLVSRFRLGHHPSLSNYFSLGDPEILNFLSWGSRRIRVGFASSFQ